MPCRNPNSFHRPCYLLSRLALVCASLHFSVAIGLGQSVLDSPSVIGVKAATRLPASDHATGESERTPSQRTAADQPATSGTDFAALRRQVSVDIQRLEETISKRDGRGATNFEASLLGHLRFLDTIYAQHQLLRQREVESRQELAQLSEQRERFKLLGWSGMQINSFAALEQTRDDLDDARFQLELVETELASTESILASVREQHASNERQRRLLQEAYTAQSDQSKKARIRQQLNLIELRSRIAAAMMDLRTEEIEAKKLERRVHEQRRDLLAELIPQAADNLPFTQQDLDGILAGLDTQTAKLQQRQQQQQHVLQQLDACTIPARDIANLEREQWITSKLRDMRRAAHRNIGMMNDSSTALLLMRHAWKMRFRVANRQASTEEMLHIREEANKFLTRVNDSEGVIAARTEEVRLEIAAAQREHETLPHDLEQLQQTIKSDWYRTVAERREGLRETKRILERLKSALQARLGEEEKANRFAQLVPTLNAWWDYELLAVDDRPITLGKLISGLVLLAFGVLVARQVSQTVGRRMLPRMGVHQGASLAAQTIAFYSLVMLFGLFTLELLNIPITVLTFFGGAAAIAIGFGAQNILNNFMSGLIILGEQPIRVGDLIEVDGLHGTIEHIGGRSTRIRTGSNYEMIVPNSKFLENNVTNLTLSNTETRRVVQVGVAYGSDVDLVIRLLKEVGGQLPFVLRHPEPIILFTEFGDNALTFEIYFWIHMRVLMDGQRAESEMRRAIERTFREQGVTIAYPQRDVHLDVQTPIEVRLPDASRWKQAG